MFYLGCNVTSPVILPRLGYAEILKSNLRIRNCRAIRLIQIPSVHNTTMLSIHRIKKKRQNRSWLISLFHQKPCITQRRSELFLESLQVCSKDVVKSKLLPACYCISFTARCTTQTSDRVMERF